MYVCVSLYIPHNFFIHSSVDGHVVCFRILATWNSAANEYISSRYWFHFLRQIPRIGTAAN